MMGEMMRIAAVADLHSTRARRDDLRSLFTRIAEEADVLVVCGDLTDNGMPQEAETLADSIDTALDIPVIAVLGNHDHEKEKEEEIAAILSEAGIRILDGDACEIDDVGFAGVKGFAGGFRDRELQPWGEYEIKAFVNQAVQEGLKLEAALSRLASRSMVVLLHYSPVPDTVIGEPPEIFPFLGSSRLERAIDRYPVTAVFHGHAHHGRSRGTTRGGVPVYNVSAPVLRREDPDRPPFRLITVEPLEPAL